MPATAGPRRVPRWLGALVVAGLAGVATLALALRAHPAGDAPLTPDELTLVLVLVAGLLPRADLPVRHRIPLGSALGTRVSLAAWAFVPVSVLPLAVVVGAASGARGGVLLAVLVATVLAESVPLAMRGCRGREWWRVPVLVAARGVLVVAALAACAGLQPTSPLLLLLVPGAYLLETVLMDASAIVLRRITGWPRGGWPFAWRAWAAALLTGAVLASTWLLVSGVDRELAPTVLLVAWLTAVVLLAWVRDLDARRALSEIATCARGLADLVEQGEITAEASRDAFLVITAHGLAMATGSWSAEVAIVTRDGERVAACVDRCPLAAPSVITGRPDASAFALRAPLGADDPFARVEVTCWDAFGIPLRFDRFAEPISDMLVASLADGRRAIALAHALDQSFADHVDAGTAVVPPSRLPEAFDRLCAEAAGDGTSVAVVVARLVDGTRSGRLEGVPPTTAGRVTQLLVRRVLAAEGQEDLSFTACRAGIGRVVLLVGDVADESRIDALIAQASALDTTVVSDDGVTSLVVAVGGAVLGRDGTALDELITVADRRSLGEIVVPALDPWVPFAVALAQRAQVPLAPWMVAPGASEHLVAALEEDADRLPGVLLVPSARPPYLGADDLARLEALGARVGMPLGQVAADHPLAPLARAIVVDERAPEPALLAGIALGRALGLPVVGAARAD